MGKKSTKYVANSIIQIANEDNIKMNNMKLYGILAYLYYDTENDLEIAATIALTLFISADG